jgi:hypothetical protein
VESNADFKDLLRDFNESGVRYLIVGAHAVMFYTEPRFTKHLDIWIEGTARNARRVWTALLRFGAPLADVKLDDFLVGDLVYQIGVAPNRVDILMGLPGVRFPTAWHNRKAVRFLGVRAYVLSRRDLIRSKRKAGRPQDMLDLAWLRHPGGPVRKRRRGRRKA